MRAIGECRSCFDCGTRAAAVVGREGGDEAKGQEQGGYVLFFFPSLFII